MQAILLRRKKEKKAPYMGLEADFALKLSIFRIRQISRSSLPRSLDRREAIRAQRYISFVKDISIFQSRPAKRVGLCLSKIIKDVDSHFVTINYKPISICVMLHLKSKTPQQADGTSSLQRSRA